MIAIPLPAVTTRTDTSTTAKSYRMKSKAKTPESDKSFEVVFVVSDDKKKAVLRVVETGIQDSKNIVIRSGLSAGEEVVIGPYTTVSKELKNESPISVSTSGNNSDKE